MIPRLRRCRSTSHFPLRGWLCTCHGTMASYGKSPQAAYRAWFEGLSPIKARIHAEAVEERNAIPADWRRLFERARS